jgi:hypothetical protein
MVLIIIAFFRASSFHAVEAAFYRAWHDAADIPRFPSTVRGV